MFVSIHIPKTAGTALAKIFDDSSQRRIMYDYGTERDIESVRTCPEEVRASREFIKNYFKYLHGHFHYLKYADVFGDCPFIVTVRHPVDRIVSQYLHIARSGDPNNWRHKKIMDGEMDIVEFSKYDFIGNAQWYYLEGREVEDYDFIFVQESLNHSMKLFCDKFGVDEVRDYLSWSRGVPGVNKRPKLQKKRKSIKITDAQKREVFKNCTLDVDVYERAKACMKQKKWG